MRGCSCGEILRANDRYCRSCGREATQPASSRSRPLAALGVLAVLVMAWALFRWPQDSSASELSPDPDSELGDGGAGEDPDSEFEPIADGRLGPLDPDDFPTPDADGVEAAQADEEESIVVTRTEAAPGEPLLGELTGLGLAVGGAGQGQPLQIIAFDSREALELPDVEGWPVGMIGTNLIVRTRSTILAVDLAAPEPAAELIVDAGDSDLLWALIDRERIWTLETSSQSGLPERAVAYEIDGRQTDSLDLESGLYSFLWRSVPDLVFNQAGGIYRRSNGEVEHLADGALVAVGERTALVYRCDDAMECRSYWHDRVTWESLSFGQPPGNPLISFTMLMGDDRWVATTSIYNGATTVAAIETGEVVQEFDVSLSDRPDAGLSASPDGRWFFGPSSGDDKIIDMDSGDIWLTGLVFPSEFGRLLIDLSGTALDR